MQKNKVLIIRNAWGFGGAENYPLNLAVSLKRNGFHPIVVTNVPELRLKCVAHNIRARKSMWYKKQGWGRIYYLRSPLTKIWFIYLMLRHRANIIHPQGRDDFIFATSAARLLRKPVVWTDHGDLKYVMKNDTPRKLKRAILKNARYTNGVIAVSNSERKEILKSYPRFPNLVTIYNGVFPPKKPQAIPRKSNKTIVLSTSRLIDTKGIRELLNGYSKINNLKDTELWLVGKGENEEEYKIMVKELGIESYVKFWGFQEKVNDFLASTDIFIHPSYHEAFSLSLIEACMAGKPIVATAVGGNVEIVDESNGILIPPMNADAITDALNTLVNNKKFIKRMGERGAKRAHESFNFEDIVKKEVIPLYKGEKL